MKLFLGTALTITSTVAMGMFLIVTGGEYAVAKAVTSQISSETPVEGLTLGVVLAGILVGFGFLVQGGRYLVAFGVQLGRWKTLLTDAAKSVDALSRVVERLDEHDRRIAVLESLKEGGSHERASSRTGA